MEHFNDHYKVSGWIVKYLRSELSVTEKENLESWIKEKDSNSKLFQRLTNYDNIYNEFSYFSNPEKEKSWQRIQTYVESKNVVSHQRFYYKNLMKYAAILVCLLGSMFFIIKYYKHQEKTIVKHQPYLNDIQPGGNIAILELSNGQKIRLDSANGGKIATEQDIIITKSADGQLIYDWSNVTNLNHQELSYNTIITPKGGKYQLKLADGTKVWLNAMSSLKFPTAFSEKERIVELVGEAYFEVQEDKDKPFLVKINGTEVKVLGTHFNISAYADENHITTTLLEGAVKIKRQSISTLLKPGQEVRIDLYNNLFLKRQADIEKVIAWKNDCFVFRDESIESLMTTISRWYNIEVSYKGNMDGKVYGGKFSRKNNLSELLKSLELTGTVKFTVEERRVTVMP